jgi:hypothetical protein
MFLRDDSRVIFENPLLNTNVSIWSKMLVFGAKMLVFGAKMLVFGAKMLVFGAAQHSLKWCRKYTNTQQPFLGH